MNVTKTECIRTVFKVYKHCVDTTACVVALYGSHSCLGEWRAEHALISQHTGLCEWQINALLPKSAMLSYKLVLLDSRTRHVLHEEKFTRYLDTDETPLYVELTYGDFSCKKSPMASHMRTGIQEIGKPRLNMDYFLWNPQEKWQLEVKSFHSKVGSALEHFNAKYGRQHSPRPAKSMGSVYRKPDVYWDKVVQTASSTKQDVGMNMNKYLMPGTTTKQDVGMNINKYLMPGTTTKQDVDTNWNKYLMPSTPRKPVGVSTNTDLMPSPSPSLWSRIVGNGSTGDSTMNNLKKNVDAKPVLYDNEKERDQNDKKFSLREMMPSPYRMVMLGLAVGACVYSKMKK